MFTRRQFLTASAFGTLAPARAWAQSRPVKVGMLVSRPLSESWYAGVTVQRLAQLGYRRGVEMVLEYRSADGRSERYPALARELIDLKCDLVFSIGPELTVRPFVDASVQVVFIAIEYDPLAKALVPNLRQPGGNITGVYTPQHALLAKRLEIMREVVPMAERFLVLSDPFSRDQLLTVRQAAEAGQVKLTVVEFPKRPYDLAGAFEAGKSADIQALIGLASPVFASHASDLAVLLAKHGLPGVGPAANFADRGYLLSYGADPTKMARRAAEIGVTILKGARAAEIPVQQADEYELVVNRRTAKALRMKLPQSVLARATRIIQ